MSRERAQALVEAVAAVPVAVACAVTLVDAGTIVRDRIATTQAATRAAEARLAGRDEHAAARDALPAGLRDSLQLSERDGALTLTTESRTALTQLAHADVQHRSRVELAEGAR